MSFKLIPAEFVLSGRLLGQYTLIGNWIQSSNFVHNVSGWQIDGNGNAEFNNLTLRGTFFGTDYIINANGAFFYAPTEAAGNLILSITPQPCTGPFGETISIGGVQVINTTFGTVAQLVAGALNFFAGVTNTMALGSGGLRIFNSHGATIFSLDTARDAFFLYVDTGSATQGALISSISYVSGSGTDSFGNKYVTEVVDYNGSQFAAMQGGQFVAGDGTGVFADWYAARGFGWATNVPIMSSDPHGPAFESWHTVGAAGQPAFGAGFAAGTPAARFQLLPMGSGRRVALTGTVVLTANQLAGATMFTLPTGYVPAVASHTYVTGNNLSGYALGSGVVTVTSAGAVQIGPAGTNGNFLRLDGIEFELD